MLICILNYEAARNKLIKVCKNLKMCPSPYFTCRSYLSIGLLISYITVQLIRKSFNVLHNVKHLQK